ncbi:MAG: hypothetical protein K1060chlam5_00831 [Candidatus Anoxychlamydiales bacterium]|nr:hypothetical protein [Candidatus Anoxychlamydiales bacterium]
MKKSILSFLVFTCSLVNLFSIDSFTKEKKYNSSIDDSNLFKKDDSVYYTNIEFLYWTAEASSLDYAIRQTKDDSIGSNLYSRGEYQLAKYDWDPGFRISLGWFNAPKFWRVLLGYTYQRINGDDTSTKPSSANQYLLGTWPQIISNNLTTAKSNIKLDYDLIDLLLSRIFNPNEHLRIRFIGGLTAAKLRQTWSVKYQNDSSQTNDIYNKWKFYGVGLKIGSDIDWFWGHDFYLTANGFASSNIGRYHNVWRMNASIDSLERADAIYKNYRLAFHTLFLLGPSYQRSFENNRFEMFLGYELNSWFNVHEKIVSTRSTSDDPSSIPINNSGVFSMHGLSARLTLDF